MTPEEIAANLDDPAWRLSNLYKIITKGDDDGDDEGLVVTFDPNAAQQQLMSRMWHRNVILKARQLGMTTLVAMLWLDTALFSKDPIQCGIIAQGREEAEKIFKDKVKFAYNNLPEALRANMPLANDSASELKFLHNGSSIRVATSMRSGTIHRLHISEFGKICAKFPDKAKEVITGSIPAVPKSGILIVESTAEGQEGAYYSMVQRAKALHEKKATLSVRDYQFHFFPWWSAPEYTLDPEGVIFTETHNAYFNQVEAAIGRTLTLEQRAWYVATLESDFDGEAPLMWQEYPSTPDEAFQVSTEGCYYAKQLALARKDGRVRPRLPVESAPVNTFWDLGRGDATAIWFHQRIGPENRWIRYYEESGEDLPTFVKYLQDTGYTFGTHYVPHDAEHKRLGVNPDTNRSIKEMLEGLMPGQRFKTVPRVTTIMSGIQATRAAFGSCWFDEEGCGEGLKRLANYKKEWDKTNGRWRDTPKHDENSHGADAFRQFAQEASAGNLFPHGGATSGSGSSRRRRGGMAV